MSRRKIVRNAVIGVIIIAAIGVGSIALYSSAGKAAAADTEASYREYTVTKGDITVGLSESGTVSLERQYVTFAADAEAAEILVNMGSYVSEGDPVARFDADDIESVYESYEKKIAAAKLELDIAETEAQTKLYEAKRTYESALSAGELADGEYSISAAKTQSEIYSAEKAVESAKTQIAEYTALAGSYPEDYAVLTEYENNIEEYESVYDGYQDQYEIYEDEYDALSDVYSEYESKYREMTKVYSGYEKEYDKLYEVYSGYEKVYKQYESELNDVQREYDSYLESISDKQEKITSLRTEVETTFAAKEAAQEEYDEAYEDYISKYGISYSSDDTAEVSASQTTAEQKLEELQKQIDKTNDKYYAALQAYVGYYKNLDNAISKKIDGYEEQIAELKSEMEEYGDKMEDYKSDVLDEYTEKMESYQKNEMTDYSEMMEDYKIDVMDVYAKQMEDYKSDVMDPYYEMLSDYRAEYEEFKSDFQETYGNLDSSDIDDKIGELKDNLSDNQLSLTEAVQSSEGAELSARQKLDSAKENASSALDVYNNTVSEINSSVEEKRDEYNTLVEEYEEFKSEIDSGGYVFAPCSGSVASVSISEGDSYMAGQTIAAIMDESSVYMSVSVSEEDITSLTVGQECSITLSSYENKSFSGYIRAISTEPARSSGSVSYSVEIQLGDTEGVSIYEGMSGDVTFLQKQVSNVLYINNNAVSYHDGASWVKVYDDNGQVIEKKVKTGFTDGKYVEITDGLSSGDKVLAESAVSAK